jgi:hypothetical protein
MSSGYRNNVLSIDNRLVSQDCFKPIMPLQDFKII